VQAEAQAPFRQRPQDIGRFYVRSSSGEMVPLSALVQTEMRGAPSVLTRFNGFPSAMITGAVAPGHSSGEVLDDVERLVAEKYAAQGIGYAYSGQSYQERVSAGQSGIVIALGLVLVFLVLAAQYESLTLPLAIILIVPMCLLAAVTGVLLDHGDNNIFTQVGLIVLLGLACKNAILIVEFAKHLQEEQGHDATSAVLEAARMRLRPILMTSFAFIMGVVPLMVAGGAGAEIRHTLGTTVFAGMLGVLFFGLLLTPVFYVLIRRLTDKKAATSEEADHRLPAPEANHV
jgi:multidrug efflux pump subunit AcrB